MNTVHVKATREYDVLIGSGLLRTVGSHAAKLKTRKVCIVSDTNVWPLYGDTVTKSFSDHAIDAVSFVFEAGEQSKNAGTYLQLLNFLAEEELNRTDLILALGGGVVGDLAGFAAATYLRGIPYIQAPTTLLAAVDSSVGGKTAIDLPAGKNLAGAFCQPHLVLCDTDCLDTLPEDIFRDGCAEVIKYGILYDPDLISYLARKGLDFDRKTVITRCVELKRDVVAEDEFDTGARMMLNLGHTIGHAVEKQSHFTLSHGKAVAIGMAIVARAGETLSITGRVTKTVILETLKQFGLPLSCSFTADELYEAALSDKKRSGDFINLVIPRFTGDCVIRPMPVDELKSFIKAGL